MRVGYKKNIICSRGRYKIEIQKGGVTAVIRFRNTDL